MPKLVLKVWKELETSADHTELLEVSGEKRAGVELNRVTSDSKSAVVGKD